MNSGNAAVQDMTLDGRLAKAVAERSDGAFWNNKGGGKLGNLGRAVPIRNEAACVTTACTPYRRGQPGLATS